MHSYCTICGKIGDRFKENKSIVKDYRRTVDTPIGKCYSLITDEELYEKYHDKLPVFFIENIFLKRGMLIWNRTIIQMKNNYIITLYYRLRRYWSIASYEAHALVSCLRSPQIFILNFYHFLIYLL